MLLGLGHPEHFFNCGGSGADLVPPIHAQRAHPLRHGFLRNGGGRSSIENEGANLFIQNEQFVNSEAPLVSQLPAKLTTSAMPEFGRLNLCLGKSNSAGIILLHFLFRAAMSADG